jgi:RNA polymerase sigma-70 factor (ECF subfamily)
MTEPSAQAGSGDGSASGPQHLHAELPPEILRGFAAGDETAFAQVYQRYSGPMFVVALRVLGSRELAADAMQQAFLQAWRAAATVSPDTQIAGWLFTIAKRCAIDVWRKEGRHVGPDASPGAMEDPSATPDLDKIWDAWQVRSALDELANEEREVVRLAYFEGLSQSQIASRLDIPLGTVKSRTGRAQRQLGQLLAHLAPEPTTEVAP